MRDQTAMTRPPTSGQGYDVHGEAKDDRFTIVVFISFTVVDIDERPAATR